MQGTNEQLVLDTLGYPDGAGPEGGMTRWSYGFLGVDLFFAANRSVFAIALTDPYYGKIDNTAEGIGSKRAPLEDAMQLGAGKDSAQAGLVCYTNGTSFVGVTYAGSPEVATEIRMPFLQCP